MRKALLIALAVVALFLVLPFAFAFAFEVIASETGGCSERQMRVFREFPHYGGKRPQPQYNSQGCFVAYTTEDPTESVRKYYTQQLTASGWTLDQPPPPAEGEASGALDAARGQDGYEVLTESTRDGTSVVVYVIEREE